jgi:hypothetical protein
VTLIQTNGHERTFSPGFTWRAFPGAAKIKIEGKDSDVKEVYADLKIRIYKMNGGNIQLTDNDYILLVTDQHNPNNWDTFNQGLYLLNKKGHISEAKYCTGECEKYTTDPLNCQQCKNLKKK